ncbi:hypothetical protein SH139x_001525 [Planctomycetaceae bacterium SH139]
MMRLSSMFVALALSGICAIAVNAQERLPAAIGSPDQVPDGVALDVLLRQHAQLNERGELIGSLNANRANGQVRGLAKLPIGLIQNGRLLARAETSPNGDFMFPGLSPGVYTLAAANAQELIVLPILISGQSPQATPISLVTASSISADRRQAVLANLYGPQTSRRPNWSLAGGA